MGQSSPQGVPGGAWGRGSFCDGNVVVAVRDSGFACAWGVGRLCDLPGDVSGLPRACGLGRAQPVGRLFKLSHTTKLGPIRIYRKGTASAVPGNGLKDRALAPEVRLARSTSAAKAAPLQSLAARLKPCPSKPRKMLSLAVLYRWIRPTLSFAALACYWGEGVVGDCCCCCCCRICCSCW